MHHHHENRVWLRVAVWLSWCSIAAWVLLRGQSDLYIAPDVRWTLWLAIAVSLIIAALDGYSAWQYGIRPPVPRQLLDLLHERPNWSYGLVFLPFLFGIGIPPAVLGTESVLGNESAVTLMSAPLRSEVGSSKAERAFTVNLLQLHDQLQAGLISNGSQVQVSGFIVHWQDLPADTWMLVRFITPHCVAEAHPLGLLIHQTGSMALRDDTWVTVTGIINGGSQQGHSVGIIQSPQVKRIDRPVDPYLIY
jgi:uncharacterized repeat protein (TIGR03943 family)